MDIKFTFEDGSEAYLQHYGVLGMKWGVHNAETKAKYGEAGGRRKKTEAEIEAVRAQRSHDRKEAAAYAGLMTGVTFAKTGNVPLAGITFGAAYASRRISSAAVRKGQPLLDKMIKDPDVRWAVKTVADVSMTIGGTMAFRQAGVNAVNGMLQAATDVITTPHAHSLGGALANNGPKPHASVTQPSHGISQQLSTANIPSTLTNNGTTGTHLTPVHTGGAKPHPEAAQVVSSLSDQLSNANIPEHLKRFL